MAAQAVEALIAPAQSAASAGRGLLSSLWSGIGGLQEGIARSITPPGREGQQPQPQVSGPMPVTYGSIAPSTPPGRDGQPGGSALPNLGNPVLDALVMGMHQLQTLQVNQLNNPKKDDAPESVKPGITALPKLTAPDPLGGLLDFQDWLQQIAGLMSDLSDSSHLWRSGVIQVSKDAYDRWVTAPPIERLQVEPDDRPELVEGK